MIVDEVAVNQEEQVPSAIASGSSLQSQAAPGLPPPLRKLRSGKLQRSMNNMTRGWSFRGSTDAAAPDIAAPPSVRTREPAQARAAAAADSRRREDAVTRLQSRCRGTMTRASLSETRASAAAQAEADRDAEHPVELGAMLGTVLPCLACRRCQRG